jgi:hypothetical protein
MHSRRCGCKAIPNFKTNKSSPYLLFFSHGLPNNITFTGGLYKRHHALLNYAFTVYCVQACTQCLLHRFYASEWQLRRLCDNRRL